MNDKYTKPYLHHIEYIDNIIELIYSYDNVKDIITIREHLHNIILYDIDLNTFKERLYDKILLNNQNFQEITELSNIISKYDQSMSCAYKKLYHLESMIANIINSIKN
jgi:hypothetical protein